MSSIAAATTSRSRHLRDWDDLASQRPLPVCFALYPSRRVDRALCPALVLRTDGVEVIRILDPEHKQPFFALDSIFLLAGLTPIAGLMRFKLRRERGEYDVTLAGLEPRDAIWSPWATAHAIAEELGLFPALQTLFTCKHAWSLDERSEGFSHNWCVSSEQIDPSTYSLSALLEKPFSTVTLLPRRQQIRTLMSGEQRTQATEAAAPVSLLLGCPDGDEKAKALKRRARLEQSLIRWTVRAYEQWVEQDASVWSLHAVDILLFLHTLLPAHDDDVDEEWMDLGQDGMSVEELRAWSLHRQSHSAAQADDEERQASATEEARACLHLVDHLARLYLDRAVLCARQEFAAKQEGSAGGQDLLSRQDATKPVQHPVADDGQSDIKVHLLRLVTSAKRTEEAVNALTRQEKRTRKIDPAQSIPWPLFTALAIGFVLGSVLIRQ